MRLLNINNSIIKTNYKRLKQKKHLFLVSNFGALTSVPFKSTNMFITRTKARSLDNDDFKTIVKAVGTRISKEGLNGNSIINDGPINGFHTQIALRCFDCENCAYLSVGCHDNNDIGINTISCVGETISQTTLQRVLVCTAIPKPILVEMISICPVGYLTIQKYNFCLL